MTLSVCGCTCKLFNLAVEVGEALPEAHHAREHVLLQLEDAACHTAAAALALEGTVTVPASAWQLSRPRHCGARTQNQLNLATDVACEYYNPLVLTVNLALWI